MQWINQHLSFDGGECLFYPFGRLQNGYAAFCRGGRSVYVHRFMCEHRHGPAPSAKHQAAHSCGRGAQGCVNAMHLSWKTNSENQLDRTDGKGRRRTKLTAEQAAEIRAAKGIESVWTLAARFGVGETTIRAVQAGQRGIFYKPALKKVA